jgi:DNA-binding GntR family transcriptional regulator
VRQLVASRNVSPATVFEAYYLLEARGLIRSKPRSGYFVATPVRPEALRRRPRRHPTARRAT